LVETLGWRQALVALALILLTITLPLHITLLRRRPEDIGEQVDGGPVKSATKNQPNRPTPPSIEASAAIRSPAFALLTISFTASMMAIVALGVHLVPLLQARGLSALDAAAIGGLIGVAAMPGRLIFTPLGAYISRHAVTAAIFAAQLLGLLALMWIPDRLGVTLFVVLFGVGFGAITPARAALVVETFGARWYGTISGRMSLIGTVARAAAPVGVGWLLERNPSGGLALGFVAILTLVAAVAVMAATWAPNESRPTASGPKTG
jgi:MFS family permease